MVLRPRGARACRVVLHGAVLFLCGSSKTQGVVLAYTTCLPLECNNPQSCSTTLVSWRGCVCIFSFLVSGVLLVWLVLLCSVGSTRCLTSHSAHKTQVGAIDRMFLALPLTYINFQRHLRRISLPPLFLTGRGLRVNVVYTSMCTRKFTTTVEFVASASLHSR